jgi:tRNA G18 (ribose-2'-O)-methylase SpoU
MMEWISSLDDPRVAFYRNLRERTLRGESIFLAEGKVVTERLLQSSYPVESLLVAESYASHFAALVPPEVPLYVTAQALLEQIVGFKYHQGVLAAGRRPPEPTFEQVMEAVGQRDPLRMVICPEVTKPENLGLIFRNTAAFDLDAVILGPQACDPLSRRVLRVSMGAVLFTKFGRSRDLLRDLSLLRTPYGIALVAAVVDRGAQKLQSFSWPSRIALVVGGEFFGLSQELVALADYQLTIPMSDKVDSLNLGVATGIFAYEMTRRTFGAEPRMNLPRELNSCPKSHNF